MNKIKFKIKISNKIVNLNNYFIDQFNKFKKLNKIKFKIKIPNKFGKLSNYFIDQFKEFNKPKNFKFKKISNFSLSIILFISLLFLYLCFQLYIYF